MILTDSMYSPGKIKSNWVVPQIKFAERPKDRQPDTCHDCIKHCNYECRLPLMPDVLWCKKYGKQLKNDWPFPKRLPECEATEDWFSEWRMVISYKEL